MKISFNWLREYIDLHESAEKTGQRLTDTGLEVEGLEKIEQVPGGMAGIVIGEVVECNPHPNADKLSLTKVDIGEKETLSIVCGAPNVAAGQKVLVATVNTKLFPTSGDPFVIKKAKIRGEVSQGMICAEDEIGLGTSHAGILILQTNLKNGTPAAEYFQLEEDQVFEIGLTPNRADAASHIGVARDLKAVTELPVKWPDTSGFKSDDQKAPIEVEVKDTKGCIRYSGITIDTIEVGPSPEWLQRRLRSIGIASINNVVDSTNYVLHEMGQPLHAFDAEAIKGDKIIVGNLAAGTKFITLDEKERLLQDDDLMICNGEEEAMCIAGIFGGLHSGVTDSTKKIFLESACFSADRIRKTAQYHKLKTDASFRFERGTDPEGTVTALKRAALLIKEIAKGTIAGELIDIYPSKIVPVEISVSYQHIHRLIGISLKKEKIHAILESLDIHIIKAEDKRFTASVPPYRVDVTREADIIEEILRIYGFNQIPLPETVGSDYLADFPLINPDSIQKTISEYLNANGFYEVITNSLTKPEYAEKSNFLEGKESVEVLNKLSEDLGVMRQSLLFGLLEVTAHNSNRRQTDLRLFEFGKQYKKKEAKYQETRRLGIMMTGDMVPENWQITSRKAEFHDLSGVVRSLIERIYPGHFETHVIQKSPFRYGLEITIGGATAGWFGKVEDTFIRKFGIKQHIFYADIDWDLLLSISSNNIVYREVPKFPEVRRDLSLVIDKKTTFNEIRKVAHKYENHLLKDLKVFDVYEGDKIGKEQKAYAINFTLQDENRTLTDKVIDKTMNRLMSAFEQELNAIIRK